MQEKPIEYDFLQRFNQIYKAVDKLVDMNNTDLVAVVRDGIQNERANDFKRAS